MNASEIDILMLQLKNIILNKPVPRENKIEEGELADLQEVILYLADCLEASNAFLQHLSRGDLDVVPPGRHNFLAGNLKELHAGLRHLTWQADQVANGDYRQRVSFLGEFSESFNQMIHQLEERETKLKNQSDTIYKSMDLLVAIMDGFRDWIVVTEEEAGGVLYINQSARERFYDPETKQYVCGHDCTFMDELSSYEEDGNEELTLEFTCPLKQKTLYAKSFPIQWDGKRAYAHMITDVTCERGEKKQLESMAFMDVLTGLYNRRYCMIQLATLLEQGAPFSLCVVDLDGLKFVNDTFGHISGDLYLKTISEELLTIGRATDSMCRVGGDEFVLIFPGCPKETVLKKVECLEQKVLAMDKGFPMSFSYGVVEVSEGKKEQQTLEGLLSQADEKMYQRKNKKKELRRLQCYSDVLLEK